MRISMKVLGLSVAVAIVIVSLSFYWFTQAPEQKPQENLTDGKTLVEWKPDGVVVENNTSTEYSHKLDFADGKLVIYWRNDDEYLYMALEGQTNGWVAVGFGPTTGMKDADMVFGWVKDGDVTLLDLYSTGVTGPHPRDTDLGGTSDILDYGGMEDNGSTTIEFKRKLDTGDDYDKAFSRGQTVKIIWALATVDELATKHNIVRGGGELTLD